MLPLLSNAFNDPSNPWYYVIGVVFLLLIFGALAVYIVWSGKKNKESSEKQEQDVAEKDAAEHDDKATDNIDTVDDPDPKEQNNE